MKTDQEKKNDLKLEIGAYYLLRNGDVVQLRTFDKYYAYWKHIIDFQYDEQYLPFTTELNGRFNKIVETEFDVVRILDDEFYLEYYIQLEVEKYDKRAFEVASRFFTGDMEKPGDRHEFEIALMRAEKFVRRDWIKYRMSHCCVQKYKMSHEK